MWLKILFALQLVGLDPATIPPQNQELLTNLLKSPYAELRINGLDKSAELRDSEWIGKISELLKDSEPEVRFHAARALSKFSVPESSTALKGRLPEESDPYVAAELRRSITTVEDNIKAATEKADKAEKAEKQPKTTPPAKAPKARTKKK